ncbi:MAG: transporter permease [Clostridiales bacterium]|jgi:putative ABC transport system permease protein|nr:transporter permease [Clostridiales bacterium]
MEIVMGVLDQGLIFAIVAIGVYITYKILDFPDMSVDGTFPLGAAVAGVCLTKGINPFVASAAAFAAGCIGGAITGILHVKLRINNLLSGILVMFALYSINLRIMGKSNIPLFAEVTVFSSSIAPIVIIAIFAFIVKLLLDLFLKTKLGFALIATGNNEQLVTMLGLNKDNIKLLGLVLANGIVALAGSLMAQYQGFSDVGMGAGTIVTGLAAITMGINIFKRLRVVKSTTMVVLGSILYKGAIAIALKLGLEATDLKLITALIVIIALSFNKKNFNFKVRKRKSSGGDIHARNKESMQSV